MEYRIVLQRMEFRALHGCYELERKVGNRFTVDLEITACLGDAAAEDSVEQTVNYLTVYEVVSLQMRITQRTIERVAMNIIEAVYRFRLSLDTLQCIQTLCGLIAQEKCCQRSNLHTELIFRFFLRQMTGPFREAEPEGTVIPWQKLILDLQLHI